MTERKIEQKLVDSIESVFGNVLEAVTFAECGLLTSDKGVVVTLEGGIVIYLTIQGYMPKGRRME